MRYNDTTNKLAIFQTLAFTEIPKLEIMFCCTHLHWNPQRPIQYYQAKELKERLEAFKHLPQIIGGDFNADDACDAIKKVNH